MIKTLAFASALAAAATGSASLVHAETLTPVHNQTVDLGETTGSAYYVVSPNGYHVVATLLPAGAGSAVRFDTVLTDGQSATVSIPGPVGTPPKALTFVRVSDHLEVRHSSDARSVATQ